LYETVSAPPRSHLIQRPMDMDPGALYATMTAAPSLHSTSPGGAMYQTMPSAQLGYRFWITQPMHRASERLYDIFYSMVVT